MILPHPLTLINNLTSAGLTFNAQFEHFCSFALGVTSELKADLMPNTSYCDEAH